MRDALLMASGALAVIVAVVHAVLGETRVFATSTIEPRRMRLLLRFVWHAGAVAWGALGVLLALAPSFGSASARAAIITLAVATFATAAAGNAYATRGRHPGWMLLAVVIVAAIAGR